MTPNEVVCMMETDEEKNYLAHIARDKRLIIEIGSWKGGSAVRMASVCSGIIYCIDTWRGSPQSDPRTTREAIENPLSVYHQFMENVLSVGFLGTKIFPMMLNSKGASVYFKDGCADVVFIDGSHSYQDVLDDMRNFWPKVKVGGIMCGHDWYLGEVPSAVKTFSSETGISISVPVSTGWGMWEMTKA